MDELNDGSFYRRIREAESLRALAICAVILHHIAKLKGGFIGVDIFFVISGYVITLSILRDFSKGTFTLGRFALQRIKRIIPPILVLSALIMGIASQIFMDKKDFAFIVDSYPYQAFFSQNLFFVERLTAYFSGLTEAKLNLHLWSLAVEEQFYILLPLLFFMFGRKKLGHVLLLSTLVIVFSIPITRIYSDESLRLMIRGFLTGAGITGAWMDRPAQYYLLPTRAWEPMLGVVACLIANNFRPDLPRYFLPRFQTIHRAVVFACVAGIAGSLVFVNPAGGDWPNLLAVIPTLATAVLLIEFHFINDAALSRWLTLKPITFLGLTSYSLYLYHWPLFGVLKYTNSSFGTYVWDYAVYLVPLIGLSWLSYRFVEQQRKRIPNSVALGLLAVFFLGHYFAAPIAGAIPRYASEELSEIAATSRYSSSPQCQSVECYRIDKDFVVLWGDSHAVGLYEALQRYCESRNWSLLFLRGIPLESPSALPQEILASPRLKGVVLANRWSWFISPPDNTPEDAETRYFTYKGRTPKNTEEAAEVFRRSLDDLLGHLKGANTIIVEQVPRFSFFPPREAHMEKLHLRLRSPELKSLDEHRKDIQHASSIFDEAKLRTQDANLTFVDPSSVLCRDGVCRWRDGDSLLYYDDDHLSVYGAQLIIPLVTNAIEAQLRN